MKRFIGVVGTALLSGSTIFAQDFPLLEERTNAPRVSIPVPSVPGIPPAPPGIEEKGGPGPKSMPPVTPAPTGTPGMTIPMGTSKTDSDPTLPQPNTVPPKTNDGSPAPEMPPQGTPGSGTPIQGTPIQGTIPGQPIQGQPIQGIPIQGTIQGQPIQGIPIQGQPIQGTIIQGNPVPGTVIQGTPIQGHVIPGAPYQGVPTTVLPQGSMIPQGSCPPTQLGAPSGQGAVHTDGYSPFCQATTRCPGRFWASAEYLLWWMKQGPLNSVLVTTGSAANTTPGALGQSATVALFGNRGFNTEEFSGGRVTVGGWLDRSERFGLELSGFTLLERTDRFSVAGPTVGDQVLARPFLNANTGTEAAFLFAGVVGNSTLTGRVDIASTARIWGWDANLLYRVCQGPCLEFVGLLGFRMVQLEEDLQIDERVTNLAGAGLQFRGANVAVGSGVSIRDEFDTRNRFNGPQAGFRMRFQHGIAFLDVTGKCALGVTHQQVRIDGNTQLINGAGAVTASSQGGILAQSTNIGTFTQNRFTVLPEGAISLGVHIRPWCLLRVGYNFMYWSEVARPGDQIDRAINPNLVPTSSTFGTAGGATRPLAPFTTTDYWLHGGTVGFEFRY